MLFFTAGAEIAHHEQAIELRDDARAELSPHPVNEVMLLSGVSRPSQCSM